MVRSDLAADLIAHLRSCLGADCSYKFIRSRGLPPASCDTIAIVWGDRDNLNDNPCSGGACDTDFLDELRVVLTKVCYGPDGQTNQGFDPLMEDTESQCFFRDLEVLESCLLCTDFGELKTEHGLDSFQFTGTRVDSEAEGGAYSASLLVSVVSLSCCPVEE